jgi:hypothetical protein
VRDHSSCHCSEHAAGPRALYCQILLLFTQVREIGQNQAVCPFRDAGHLPPEAEILFLADCNNQFPGSSCVSAGDSGFFSRRRTSFVKLEDPEFSSFTVYSADLVKAHHLLTRA